MLDEARAKELAKLARKGKKGKGKKKDAAKKDDKAAAKKDTKPKLNPVVSVFFTRS